MSSVSRSVRNVFRNTARTLVVIMIIGLSMGVFLTTSIVSTNISADTDNLATNMETTITIRPAGSFGFMSQDTMDESMLDTVSTVDHIIGVQPIIIRQESLAPTSTNPFSGKNRVLIQGLDPGEQLVLFGGGTITVDSGRALEAGDEGLAVAMVGSQYAETNIVGVGSSIYLNGTTLVEVVGIFTSGTRFGDNSIIAPYNVTKAAYDAAGISMVYVMVDSIGNLENALEELKTALGPEYDVVPLSSMVSEQANALQDSIDSISSNSQMGSFISLITAATVMIFIMILVTRERIKEIGVLKALGFKNSKIVGQFLIESITLSAIGFVVGVMLLIVGGPYIAKSMLGVASPTTAVPTSPTGSVRPGGGGGGGFMPSADILANVDFTPQPELLLFAFILALILGVVGSLYPILKAIKLKPAEALRYE